MSEDDAGQRKEPVIEQKSLLRTSGALLSKNVRIHGRRTSVRLEPEMWSALNEIAGIEKCTIHDICSAVDDLKEEDTSFTASLRVFIMEYYRTVAQTSERVSRVKEHLKEQQRQQPQFRRSV